MKIIPLGDRIVLKAVEAAEVVKGIIVPNSNKRPTNFTVEAVGASVTSLAVGDEVVIDAYAGKPYELEGKTYLIIQEKDVLAKVNTIET